MRFIAVFSPSLTLNVICWFTSLRNTSTSFREARTTFGVFEIAVDICSFVIIIAVTDALGGKNILKLILLVLLCLIYETTYISNKITTCTRNCSNRRRQCRALLIVSSSACSESDGGTPQSSLLSKRHGDDRVVLLLEAVVEQPQATNMLSGITDTRKNNAIRQIKPDSIFRACIIVDIM